MASISAVQFDLPRPVARPAGGGPHLHVAAEASDGRVLPCPRAVPERMVARGARRSVLLGVALAHAGGILLLAHGRLAPAPPPPDTMTAVLIELPKPMPVLAPPVPPIREPEKVVPRQKPTPVAKPAVSPAPRATVEAALPRAESATALSAPAPESHPPVEARPTASAEAAAAPKPASVPAPTPARFDAAYLNNPAPAYPPLSRRLREEGKVMLRVLVTPEGLPAKVDLTESSGSARLDQAARDAVQRWRFVPAKQDGHAVEAAVVVPIIFKLEGN